MKAIRVIISLLAVLACVWAAATFFSARSTSREVAELREVNFELRKVSVEVRASLLRASQDRLPVLPAARSEPMAAFVPPRYFETTALQTYAGFAEQRKMDTEAFLKLARLLADGDDALTAAAEQAKRESSDGKTDAKKLQDLQNAARNATTASLKEWLGEDGYAALKVYDQRTQLGSYARRQLQPLLKASTAGEMSPGQFDSFIQVLIDDKAFSSTNLQVSDKGIENAAAFLEPEQHAVVKATLLKYREDRAKKMAADKAAAVEKAAAEAGGAN